MKRNCILLLMVLMAPLAMFADNSKISPDLQNSTSGGKVQVVIQYAPGTQVSCGGLLGLVDCLVNDV